MIPLRNIIISAILGVAGLTLLNLQVDREFINLAPTEGADFAMVLQSDTVYQQTFIARKAHISRISLYVTPLTKQIPDEDVSITLTTPNGDTVQSQIPAVFINATRTATITIPDTLSYNPGDTLSITMQVPIELSGKLRIQTRKVDESFINDVPIFTIAQTPQENPLAYQAYYLYRPPFALQLGFMLIALSILSITGISLILKSPIHTLIYSAYVALAFVIPRALAYQMPWVVYIATVIALFGGITLLKDRHSPLATLFGAHAFALTSWFALHALSGRAIYALVALTPLYAWSLQKRKFTFAVIATIACGITLFAIKAPLYTTTAISSTPAHVRDIFLDPNQTPHSQKIPGQITGWDNYGSYLGFFTISVALLGVVVGVRDNRKLAYLLIGAGLVTLTPILMNINIPWQHAIILVTLSLSLFSAIGLDALHSFLGKNSRLAYILMATLTIFALLDLMNVGITTLEFMYLPL